MSYLRFCAISDFYFVSKMMCDDLHTLKQQTPWRANYPPSNLHQNGTYVFSFYALASVILKPLFVEKEYFNSLTLPFYFILFYVILFILIWYCNFFSTLNLTKKNVCLMIFNYLILNYFKLFIFEQFDQVQK